MLVLVAVVVFFLLLLRLLHLLPLLFRCRSRLVALPGCEDASSILLGSRAAAAMPYSADAHGKSCQKLRMHYTIATLHRARRPSSWSLLADWPRGQPPIGQVSAPRVRAVHPPPPIRPAPSRRLNPLPLRRLYLSLTLSLSFFLSSPRSPPTPRGLLPSPPSAVERDTGDRHRLWSYGGRGTKYRQLAKLRLRDSRVPRALDRVRGEPVCLEFAAQQVRCGNAISAVANSATSTTGDGGGGGVVAITAYSRRQRAVPPAFLRPFKCPFSETPRAEEARPSVSSAHTRLFVKPLAIANRPTPTGWML